MRSRWRADPGDLWRNIPTQGRRGWPPGSWGHLVIGQAGTRVDAEHLWLSWDPAVDHQMGRLNVGREVGVILILKQSP